MLTSALPLVAFAALPRYITNVSIDDVVGHFGGSTCFGHFNTPCAISRVYSLVDALVHDLAVAASPNGVLSNVNDGGYSSDVNFWPSVLLNGTFVASGRLRTVDNNVTVDGATLVGRSLEAVAFNESGLPQLGLWQRFADAADGDGHIEFLGWDNYHTAERTSLPAPHAVPRIGFARWASTAFGRLLVTAAFSHQNFENNVVAQACDPAADELCAFVHARRVLGRVVTDMMAAADQAQLEAVFAATVWREYTEKGFYPFVFNFDGVCVGHGLDQANVGRSLAELAMGIGATDAGGAVTLLRDFVATADEGGGWVGYA